MFPLDHYFEVALHAIFERQGNVPIWTIT